MIFGLADLWPGESDGPDRANHARGPWRVWAGCRYLALAQQQECAAVAHVLLLAKRPSSCSRYLQGIFGARVRWFPACWCCRCRQLSVLAAGGPSGGGRRIDGAAAALVYDAMRGYYGCICYAGGYLNPRNRCNVGGLYAIKCRLSRCRCACDGPYCGLIISLWAEVTAYVDDYRLSKYLIDGDGCWIGSRAPVDGCSCSHT